jgi:Zn-dependent peptidase ImmA (M78 family)/transcriptional regulator with XRE-family HTH domain
MHLNPQAILLARQSRGFSQKELSDQIGLSQSKLSKIELGQQDVPDEVLNRLVVALRYPQSFFTQALPTFTSTTSPFNYRKKASLLIRNQDRIEAQANIIRTQIRQMLDSVEFPSKVEYLNLEEFGYDMERAAESIRSAWNIPRGPIENLVKILEDVGIIVIWMDFGGLEVSGFTIQDGTEHPIIFLNRSMPGDRDRFTLSHELCHILAHRIYTLDSEEQADQFASAFLMPRRDIREMLHNLSIDTLAHLKIKWKVSMGALLYRARQVEAINKYQSDRLWIRMSQLGYRLQEPPTLNIPKEKPTLIRELIDVHLNDLKFTKLDLCNKLSTFEDEFDQVYNSSLKPFRIVLRRPTFNNDHPEQTA